MSTRKEGPLRRRIILGIDPGVSTGLAALDLDGNPLFAKSERGISLKRIIDEIAPLGKVVLVATDVTPPPDLARRIASTLKADVFIPRKRMHVPEKRELVWRYGQTNAIEVGDNHARDALASAIKAFHKFKNKFEKLEAQLDNEVPITKEYTKELLVRGFSINRAIRESKKKPTQPNAVRRLEHPEMRSDLEKKLAEKAEAIARLNDLIEALQDDIKRLELENSELKNRIGKERTRSDIELRKDRIYENQKIQIVNLTKRLHELEYKLGVDEGKKKSTRELESDHVLLDMKLLKPIESFSSKGLEMASTRFHIEPGDAVMLRDASGGGASTARMLARLQPSIVVSCTAMSYPAEEVLIRETIPVVKASALPIKSMHGHSFIPTTEIELAIERLARDRAASLVERTIESHREK
jgi:predicted RNase H-like nuclease (RuvC/YqgF family)